MPRNLGWFFLACATTQAAFLAADGTVIAQTVWTGFGHSFSKPLFADSTLPENQDRITSNVWLTRGTNQGLFNAKSEFGYDAISPADTEWATDLIATNAGKEIAATNWANLSFEPWVDAYGGRGLMQLPAQLTSRNAVVHLLTDNIYLDLRFTAWSGGGGSFTYNRATAPVTPPTITGDYNQNGVVDAADYVVWRDTLAEMASPPGSGADGDASGTIDVGDYDYWRARFGNIVGNGEGAGLVGSHSVPEPSLLALAIPAWLAMCRRRGGQRIQRQVARGGGQS